MSQNRHLRESQMTIFSPRPCGHFRDFQIWSFCRNPTRPQKNVNSRRKLRIRPRKYETDRQSGSASRKMSVAIFADPCGSAKERKTRSAIPTLFVRLTQKKSRVCIFTPLRREKFHKCFVSERSASVIISVPKIVPKFFAVTKNNKKSSKCWEPKKPRIKRVLRP